MPLLTLVILLWIVRTVDYYILEPVVSTNAKYWPDNWPMSVPKFLTLNRLPIPRLSLPAVKEFKRLESDQYAPLSVYSTVMRQSGGLPPPTTGQETYRRWADVTYLRPWIVGPVFVIIFIVSMYLLGSLFAAGLGRAFWSWI